MLVTLWTIDPGRFTQDIDFLAFGHDDEERLQADFAEILGQEVDDGLVFDLDALTAAPIRDDKVYGGMRLTLALYPSLDGYGYAEPRRPNVCSLA